MGKYAIFYEYLFLKNNVYKCICICFSLKFKTMVKLEQHTN